MVKYTDILFLCFYIKKYVGVLVGIASSRQFQRVPTTYIFMEKKENNHHF